MREGTFGVVDIGSNTVHLLVARTNGRDIFPLVDDSESLRLGKDIEADGLLSDGKIAELVDTLREFVRLGQDAELAQLHLLATHAIRTANNRDAVCRAILEATGLQVEVITPEKEAALGFMGADASCPSIGPQVMVDIGGGSMQVAIGQHGDMWDCVSLPLGAASVAARFLNSDPPTYYEEAMLVHYLVTVVPPALPLRDTNVTGILGVGGTLRRMPPLVGVKAGEPFPKDGLERIVSKLHGRSSEQIASDYDLRPDRALLMVPAAMLLREVARGYGNPPIIMADYGIREGAILSLARRSEVTRT